MSEIRSNRYILEHQFLPSAYLNNPVHLLNKIKEKKELLFYDLYNAFHIECNEKEFKINKLENEKMLVYAIKIPQPKKYADSYDCECSRIIFYFNKTKPNFARYITLEYDLFISMLNKKRPFFMLCEWTKHSHNNYGNIIGLDDDEQINLIKSFLKY